MELFARCLIVGLAAWRLSNLVTSEAGPWDVFARLRDRLLLADGELGSMPVRWLRDGYLTQLLTCNACLTVWTGTALWFAWELHPAIAAVPAAWGAALVWDRWINGWGG